MLESLFSVMALHTINMFLYMFLSCFFFSLQFLSCAVINQYNLPYYCPNTELHISEYEYV